MKAPRGSCPQEIIPLVISYLRKLERKGVRSLYFDDANQSGESPGETVSVAGKTVEARLGELEARVSVCTECALHQGRTHTVFGKGNPGTAVMFIGEGPGRDEDLKGEPFVGRSGQLLTKILAAVGLDRDDVYITNMVKCRPPQNRDPAEDEVRRCEKYLVEQIDIIEPRLICALGRIAAQWLLDTKEPLTSLRGGDNSYRGIPVLVTYHPAALLRNPEFKRDTWEDFKKLKAIISKGGDG
jgi:DNA polymerase